MAEFLGLDPGFPPVGCGLPIGNLTSQWWGNHYLAGLDHFVQRALKASFYQRYMDDFVVMGDDVGALEERREAIAGGLAGERRLALKDPQAPVRACEGGALPRAAGEPRGLAAARRDAPAL